MLKPLCKVMQTLQKNLRCEQSLRLFGKTPNIAPHE